MWKVQGIGQGSGKCRQNCLCSENSVRRSV